MPEAANLLDDLLHERSLRRDADLLAQALRIAYPLPPERTDEASRFRWLLQALAQEALDEADRPRG